MTIQKENQDEAREKVTLRIREAAKITPKSEQAIVDVYKKSHPDDLDPLDAPNADTVKLFEITSEAQAEGFVTTARAILADKEELDLKVAKSHLNINNLLDNLNVKEL